MLPGLKPPETAEVSTLFWKAAWPTLGQLALPAAGSPRGSAKPGNQGRECAEERGPHREVA